MQLTIHERQEGDVTILEPVGRVTFGPELEAFHGRVKKLIRAGKKKIVLRLDKVNQVDSLGLGAIIGAIKSARGVGGKLCLVQPSQALQNVLDLVGLGGRTDILPIFENEDEAIKSL
ncbi:MAG: STAS domain-containing protein [Terriglobia bacterium]